jgi:hypothetical protein
MNWMDIEVFLEVSEVHSMRKAAAESPPVTVGDQHPNKTARAGARFSFVPAQFGGRTADKGRTIVPGICD